jgi:peptidyl-prolyl cis-trans isomerase SurA
MIYSIVSEVTMRRNQLLWICLFCLFHLPEANASYLLDRVVAIVNQEVITWSELYRSMETEAVPGLKAMNEEERKKVFKDNERAFLDNLINFKLQLQDAKNAGIKVSDDEVKDAMENIKKKYALSEQQFQESLKSEGYTYEEYRKRLREQIIVGKLVNHQVRNKILITEEDIDAFLRENKDFKGGAEKYRIRQIFFKRPKDAADRSRIEEQAEMVYAKILQGEDFGALARQYSGDASKDVGGDLGFIDKENLAKEFGTALSSMRPGEVSRPFWTGAGLHIIKLEERTGKRNPAEIREDARTALSNRLFTERYNAWVRSLRENAFIDIRL